MTWTEIGEILGIQHQSVKNRLQHLFKKLNVKNNTQAYIVALHLNLIRMRAAIPGLNDDRPEEITAQSFREALEKEMSGEANAQCVSEKDKQRLMGLKVGRVGFEPTTP